MLDIRVQSFLMVCREMNFTRAAEKLNITQPAVSMHIKGLEEYYGAPLFAFSGKHFTLTEYGKLVYDTLCSMQNNDRYLKERISALKGRSQVVNMGATITVGEFMLSDAIGRYLNSHEQTDASVQISNTRSLLEKLDDGEIDFAVLEGDFSRKNYAHMPLWNSEFIAVCGTKPQENTTRYAEQMNLQKNAAGHAEHGKGQNMLRLSDLTGRRLLVREPGSGTRKILEDALEERDMSLENFKCVTMVGSMNAIVDLVQNSCGITFLYKKAVLDLLKEGRIKEIPLADFKVSHEISLVWCKNNIQEQQLKRLMNELFF